jgi:hypothetical protein
LMRMEGTVNGEECKEEACGRSWWEDWREKRDRDKDSGEWWRRRFGVLNFWQGD